MINLSILKGRLAESFVAGNKKIKFDIMISLINFFWISLKFHKCAILRQQIFAAFQFRGFLGQYWILWYYDFAIQSKYFISHFLNSTAVLKTEFLCEWVSSLSGILGIINKINANSSTFYIAFHSILHVISTFYRSVKTPEKLLSS